MVNEDSPLEDDDWDHGFDNYIPTTIDPGPWLFRGVALYSIGCVISVPILVSLGMRQREASRMRSRKRRLCAQRHHGEGPGTGDGDGISCGIGSDLNDGLIVRVDCDILSERPQAGTISEERMTGSQMMPDRLGGNATAVGLEDGTEIELRECDAGIADDSNSGVALTGEKGHMLQGVYTCLSDEDDGRHYGTLSRISHQDQGNSNTIQSSIKQKQNSCPKKYQTSSSLISTASCRDVFCVTTTSNTLHTLHKIIKPDDETHKLLKIGFPYALSSTSNAFFEVVTILLISKYLDVHSLSAYVIVDLLIGISSSIISGFVATLETVCSHAIGGENYTLAGQYVQIAILLYLIAAVPLLGMWWFVMEACLEWFGLSATAVEAGVPYAKVVTLYKIVAGIYHALLTIPNITGHENETKMYNVFHGIFDIILVWSLLSHVDGFNLYSLGIVHLLELIAFTAVFGLGSAFCFGWYDLYWCGLTRSFALENATAVKHVVSTAIPLAVGSLLEYGEWQVFAVFAALMGQAEVTAWGIMESIWDLLESADEGFSEAGAIRLARHLGKARIERAKLSAWKSLFLATAQSSGITVFYYFCGERIAYWFTDDEMLQKMLVKMIPMVGFANVFMAFGTMCYELIGAQGRFKVSATVSGLVSVLITIPLAAYFSIALKFELQSLVAALVVGYSTINVILAYLLILSDWESISELIIKQNEENDESLSDESSILFDI